MSFLTKRVAFAIFAFGVIALFSILKFAMPIVGEIPFIAIFILLVFIGIYFALTNDHSSVIGHISAVAVAAAFSMLAIAFSHRFGLSSFRLATWTDVWSVSCALIAIIGLWVNRVTSRHSHGEMNG